METFKLILLLVACYLLLHRVAARPNGPPPAACALLVPMHPGTTEQTVPSSVQLEAIGGMYEPGNTFEFTITRPAVPFKGFMIQARASEDGAPLGIFIEQADGKQRTMLCGAADDTLSHMNNQTVTSVTVQWRADNIDADISTFNFYYSIVQDYNTYWVRTPSDPVRVMQPPVAEGEVNYQLNGPQSLSIACVWTCVSRPPSIIQPASVPGNVPDKPFYLKDNDEEDTEPSRDYPLRAGLGIGIIVTLLLLVLAAIGLVGAA